MDHSEDTENATMENAGSEITATNKPKTQIPSNELGDAGNMDKIRYILFGAQMREQEKWYTRLEKRTFKEINSLKEETRKRFDSLETYIKNEIDTLNGRLQSEQDDRTSSAKDLSKELQAMNTMLEERIARLGKELDNSSMNLRRQIMELSKNLSDELQQKYEDASNVMEQSNQDLEANKVDRTVLSELFAEIAMRLTNDFPMDLDPESDDSEISSE